MKAIDTNFCSHASHEAAEPLAGTAPHARAWIVLEHPGPWGRDAIGDSGLAPDLVSHLTQALEKSGVRTVLARHESRRRVGPAHPRNVWVATCSESGSRGIYGEVTELRELCEWDLNAIADGHLPAFGRAIESLWQFVCTHSKRDKCCATLGRRYSSQLRGDAQVWECSHLGGHRFAPTSLFLPSGRLYGRLDQCAAYPVQSEPSAAALRGACYLQPVAQVADQAVREILDLPWSTATYVHPADTGADEGDEDCVMTVDVPTRGSWTVHCSSSTVSTPASCGAESQPRTVWRAHRVDQVRE